MEAIHKREAWNKGKLVGQKPPRKPKDIWAMRIHLQNAPGVRDLVRPHIRRMGDRHDSVVASIEEMGSARDNKAGRQGKKNPPSKRRACEVFAFDYGRLIGDPISTADSNPRAAEDRIRRELSTA